MAQIFNHYLNPPVHLLSTSETLINIDDAHDVSTSVSGVEKGGFVYGS
jgi:hypothetical protein